MQSTNNVGKAGTCNHVYVFSQVQKPAPYLNLYETQTQKYSTDIP